MERKAGNIIAFSLSCVASVIVLSGATLQALAMLTSLGVTDIFSALKLSDSAKIYLSLYLTFPVLSAVFVLWTGLLILRGSTRRGSAISALSAIIALISLLLPRFFGFNLSFEGLVGTLVATGIIGSLIVMGLSLPRIEVKKGPLLTSVEITTVAVFSALTAVFTGGVGAFIPSPTGGYTHIGDTVIFMAALLFGYKAGGLVGIIGPTVADLLLGYPRWYVTIPAHGAEGIIAGLGRGRHIALQAGLCMIGGFVMATTYFYINLFIKGYPVAIISYLRDLFGQAGVSVILGLVLTRTLQKILPQLKK